MKTTSLFAALLTVLALPATAPAQTQPAAPAAGQPTGNPGRAAIQAKLKSIVIPEVKMDQMSIEEAVDFLRTESKARDTEKDDAKKGVQFIIRAPRGTQIPPVTMTLKNMTLGEAVSRLADMAKLEVSIDATTVTLSPKQAAVSPGPAPEAVEAAKRTTLDLVDMDGQPLDAVVEFLNQKSAEKSGPKIAIGSGIDPKTEIKDLRLRNFTLAEALGIVAKEANCNVTVGDNLLTLTAR